MKRTFKKNLLLVLFTMPLLVAFQCDDDFKPDEEVENLGLIEIEENKRTFSVGQSILINTTISNQQTTIDGKTINLNDYMFRDESDLSYDLQINKIGLNDEETPYFVTKVQEIEGSIFIQDQSPFFDIISPYSETNSSFSSKIRIELTEVGTYVLKTGVIRNKTHIVSFDVRSNLGTLLMTTNIANSDNEGVYTFTVE